MVIPGEVCASHPASSPVASSDRCEKTYEEVAGRVFSHRTEPDRVRLGRLVTVPTASGHTLRPRLACLPSWARRVIPAGGIVGTVDDLLTFAEMHSAMVSTMDRGC